MKISAAAVLSDPIVVRDRSGALRNFQIVSGRDMRPNQLANLYNGVIDPQLESGMRVTPKQAEYWHKQGKDGRKVDPVFQFHGVNGAMFRPDLVFACGQIHDGSSLGFRTVLQYPL